MRTSILKSLELSLFSVAALVALSSNASENPLYSSSILHIPAVDTETQPGFYQDVVIEPAGENLWRLVEVKEGIPIMKIDEVGIIKAGSFPEQIFLAVSGVFTNGCDEVGKVNFQLESNNFNVLLYYKLSDLPPNEIACATMMTPFETIVPLPVYGLEAGEYTFTVNSGYLGSFDIERNNSL